MKVFVCAYVVFFGAAACLTTFNSCKTQAVKAKAGQYYYFPKTNIYYDVAQAEYIYSLDSGRSWNKMKNIKINETPLTLGGKVIINESGDDIWKDNETHRSLYGGSLYNIITRDTSFLLRVSKSKDIKKAAPKSDSMAGNIKKKRNFFQRLFGKKK